MINTKIILPQIDNIKATICLHTLPLQILSRAITRNAQMDIVLQQNTWCLDFVLQNLTCQFLRNYYGWINVKHGCLTGQQFLFLNS
jgi:hypothetical protein